MMKVDCYQSNTKRSFGVVVPSGTTLNSLTGDAGAAVAKLSPLVLKKKAVALSSIAIGDLYNHLEQQIRESGAGLMKTEIEFTEVLK